MIQHPPYSPGLALSNYHLFRSLSNDIKGRKFAEKKDLKQYLQDFFDYKSTDFYTSGIPDLFRRWQQVIDCNSAYAVNK